MAEPLSPLQNAQSQGFATIREIGPFGMITLRAKPDTKGLEAAVKAAVGCDLPQARRISSGNDTICAWMSPDEYLLILPYPGLKSAISALDAGLEGQHYLAADVSDARAIFRIEGASADQVLRKLTPADMDDLTEGELRRSRISQIAGAFWANDGGYTLITFRSVASYAMALLSNAAAAPPTAR